MDERRTRIDEPTDEEIAERLSASLLSTITKIGLGYAHERGARTTHIFDVTDGQADYRLEFDSVTLVWRLVREADHV